MLLVVGTGIVVETVVFVIDVGICVIEIEEVELETGVSVVNEGVSVLLFTI